MHWRNVWECTHLQSVVSQGQERCRNHTPLLLSCSHSTWPHDSRLLIHPCTQEELNLHRQIRAHFPLCSLMHTSFLMIYFLFHGSVNLQHRPVLLKLRVVFVYGIIRSNTMQQNVSPSYSKAATQSEHLARFFFQVHTVSCGTLHSTWDVLLLQFGFNSY